MLAELSASGKARVQRFLIDARSLLSKTLRDWQSDNVPRLAASLAFYTSFSIAPALVIGLAVAGAVAGDLVAQDKFTDEIREFVGPEATSFIVEILKSWRGRMSGGTATAIGICVSLFGATAAFVELQSALNLIWKSEPSRRSYLKQALYERVVAFAVVVSIGLFLLLSLVLGATVAAINSLFADLLPVPALIIRAVNLIVTLVLTLFLIAALFILLPHKRLGWRDVWVGALATSVLLTIGKYFMTMYIAHSAIGSLYGAAGSLVIILVWVYYSAHVIFFGAELTHAYGKLFRPGTREAPQGEIFIGSDSDTPLQ
ncbi:YihY/virulence factor BrkB family protein [Thermodesulfobacteriota bacterium]